MPHTPETAQEALDRDITLADEHVDSVRDLFRRERDRLAAKPKSDPVRLKEWVAVLTALWAGAGEEVYVSTVTAINPDVEPGETPVFDSFIDKAAEGIFNTSRRRIKAVRALKPTNLSRQLRKLYQVEFIQKRAPRIALDQALRQTASFEDAAAKKVEEATGVPLEKVWHNQGDSRVRSTHLSVSSVLLADPFLVGGAELRYPRDPAGTGRETFGCRCWAEHREATEETLTPAEPVEEPDVIATSDSNDAVRLSQEWADSLDPDDADAGRRWTSPTGHDRIVQSGLSGDLSTDGRRLLAVTEDAPRWTGSQSRGMTVTESDGFAMLDDLKDAGEMRLVTPQSFSRKESVATLFNAPTSDTPFSVLLRVEGKSGRLIESLGDVGDELEVLARPGSRYQYVSHTVETIKSARRDTTFKAIVEMIEL